MANETKTGEVEEHGRIYYVEPNDVYGLCNGIPVTPDYTDLCIGFDLRVMTVPRDGYVSGEKVNIVDGDKSRKETFHIFWTSYSGDTKAEDNRVSFSRGTEYGDFNYLTTYYTDINFNDFSDSEIIEGLGVESVNISFESYYTPTIKIRFIDVRGATLFGRQEYTHVGDTVTKDSIWGCLFTFPYPKFSLQVKGFYGHPVTYQLTCLDFRANFNSNTGNFEIDMTFVGYDYGILADIPTSYLLAAPHSKYYGEEYWNKHVSSSEWKLSDGTQPVKLTEISKKIGSMIRGMDDGMNYGESDDSDGSDCLDKENGLKFLKKAAVSYNNVVKRIKKIRTTNDDLLFSFTAGGELYYCLTKQGKDFWEQIKKDSILFYKNIEEYNNNCGSSGKLQSDSLIFGNTITENTEINSDDSPKVKKIDNNTYTFSTGLKTKNGYDVTINLSDYSSVESFSNVINIYETYLEAGGVQVIPLGKTKDIISQKENELSSVTETYSELTDEQSEFLNRLRAKTIYDAAGFLPTIENVFKIIMCHLETFIHMVYQCKSNIERQIIEGKRTPNKLGLKGFEFSDASKKNEDISFVPAWPAVSVNEDKGENGTAIYDSVNTIGWVGKFKGETEWEEAKLIEGLSSAWKEASAEAESVTVTQATVPAKIVCIPSDLYCEMFPEVAAKNPVALGEYLGIRAAAVLGVGGYGSRTGSSASDAGKIDAMNMVSRNGKDAVIKNLTNRADWKTKIKETAISPYTTNKDERMYVDSVGCESNNTRILTEDGDNYRYTYTEKIFDRTNENPDGDEKQGYVPIVEGGKDTVMSNSGIFSENVVTYAGKKCRNIKVKLNSNGCVDKVVYCCNSRDILSSSDDSVSTSTLDKYENPSMFSVIGGMDTSYVSRCSEQIELLKGETLAIGGYEDSEESWRKTLLEGVWNIDSYSDFLNGDSLHRYVIIDDSPINLTTRVDDCKTVNVFRHPFYYAQNDNENIEEIEASKLILFLTSAGFDFRNTCKVFSESKKRHSFVKMPYGAILLMGGMLWRAKRDKDCFYFPSDYKPFNDHKKYTTVVTSLSVKEYKVVSVAYVPKSEYNPSLFFDFNFIVDIAVKNRLIKEFEYFLNNIWANIKNSCELMNNGKPYGYNSYKDYINSFKTDAYNTQTEAFVDQFNHGSVPIMMDKEVFVTFGAYETIDYRNSAVSFSKNAWDKYIDSFCAKVEEIVKSEDKHDGDGNGSLLTTENDLDIKLAMYMYLKRIWDAWFMMASPDQFKVEKYMSHFVFMDSFYRNIGTILHINPEILHKYLTDVDGKSMLFQLLASITTDHNCHFFGFPDYFGFGNNDSKSNIDDMMPKERIAGMFKPIPFNDMSKMETSNRFVVVLTYTQNGELADTNGYGNTGFDIIDAYDNEEVFPEVFNTPSVSKELDGKTAEQVRIERYGYPIPSFGVPFGRQNQSIFKNVNVSMSNPIATEQSINALSMIADKGGSSDKVVCFYGQDLYPVYNGYSYTCTVEMMGDAQISPLMYFQLMNIPMFKGTYMIYSVTHTMKPGDMTTTFKGMKLSKYALPYAKGWFTVPRIMADGNGKLFGDVDNRGYDYHLTTTEKAKLISNGKGITRNPVEETQAITEGWVEFLRVKIHIKGDIVPNEIEDVNYKYKTLKVNKWLKDDIEKIFKKIYNVTYNGKYFVIKSVNCYSHRLTNGSGNDIYLSYHAYGAAIDINGTSDESNDNLNPYTYRTSAGSDDNIRIRTTNHEVVKIFLNRDDDLPHGAWTWGGTWRKHDYMHFQYS